MGTLVRCVINIDVITPTGRMPGTLWVLYRISIKMCVVVVHPYHSSPFVIHICWNKCLPIQIHPDWKEKKEERKKKKDLFPACGSCWISSSSTKSFCLSTACPFSSGLLLPPAGYLSGDVKGYLASASGKEIFSHFSCPGRICVLMLFQFREHFLVIKLTAFLKSHVHQKIVLFLRSQ